MNVSRFGKKMAVQSGIGQLMDDLGAAQSQAQRSSCSGRESAYPGSGRCLREHDRAGRRQPVRARRENYDPPEKRGIYRGAAHLLRSRFGWDLGRQNVALTNGSQLAFFILFNLFGGDYEDGTRKKILFPVIPEYIGYCDVGLTRDFFRAQRPKIEFIDEHTFKYHIDFERLEIAEDIGAICVSRPTNPTGNVLTKAELERLSDLALSKGIPLIVDNAYGLPFPNIIFTEAEPLWNENTVVCMSLSKLGLPGVRTGIVIARPEIIEMVARVNAVMSLAPGGVGPALLTDLVRSGRISTSPR
jgi:valine--pyruvate aminotransferase